VTLEQRAEELAFGRWEYRDSDKKEIALRHLREAVAEAVADENEGCALEAGVAMTHAATGDGDCHRIYPHIRKAVVEAIRARHKPAWCEHCRIDDGKRYFCPNPESERRFECVDHADAWSYCPICGKERP